MAATQFAADTPLLVTGLVATAGIFALWRLWVYALAFLMLAFLFAGMWRRSGVLTDAELTEMRYGGRGALALRILKAVYYSTIINCVVLAMVLVAAMRIAEVFLPWHEWLPADAYEPVLALVRNTGLRLSASLTGLDPVTATANGLISVLAIILFTATYSTTGGLRSVVNTDVVQIAVALGGMGLYAFYVVKAVGGLSGMGERIATLYGPAQTGQLLSWVPQGPGEMLMPFLTIVSLQWLFQMNADGTGYLAQRSIACRSDRDARLAGIIFAWVQILVRSLLWLVIAVGLLILLPFTPEQAAAPDFAASRELSFVTGINDLLPPGVRGLVLTGLLAALASTVDTHLNWGASYWSHDIYDRLICRHWMARTPTSRELVLVARLSNLAILMLALVLMANLTSIQQAWSISLLFGAGMGSVLVLRWLWERINLYSEVAAMAVSLVAAPLLLAWLGTDPAREWLRLSLMAAMSTAAAISVSFVTPWTDAATLERFYRRTRPAGFWPRTARLVGESPRQPIMLLRRRLRSALLTSLSLFLLLVGLGQLIIPPPAGGVLPPWSMMLVGMLLIPLWWRDAAQQDAPHPRVHPEAFDASAKHLLHILNYSDKSTRL